MPDEIAFDDCCRFILEDWRWRQNGVISELRDYKRRLLALLTQEFGISWNDHWTESGQHEGLPALASTMPKDYAALNSPFERWLEYSPSPGEQKVLERHSHDLDAAEAALKQRWVALFRDLLLLRWPEAVNRKTSWRRLRTLGLGEAVNEIDFL